MKQNFRNLGIALLQGAVILIILSAVYGLLYFLVHGELPPWN